jgi:hypothetical protein
MNLSFCLCVLRVLCGEIFFFSLRTGERRQCSRRPAADNRMQAYRKVLVLSQTFQSHLPRMADHLPSEPIKSRGRLVGVGKERDRTGAKRSGSSGRDRWWPEPGVCVKTTPSRQFDFGLGGIANHLAKAGCFIGGLKAPRAGAGPILLASEREAKRLGTFSGRHGEEE